MIVPNSLQNMPPPPSSSATSTSTSTNNSNKYRFTMSLTPFNRDGINTTAAASVPAQGLRPLPSLIVDYMAMALCDLLPERKDQRRCRRMPELVYFIEKITYQAGINLRTALVTMIYLQRAKDALPANAVGNYDTRHRIFLGALLTACKFLRDTEWASVSSPLFSSRLPPCWSRYYSYCYSNTSSFGPLNNRRLAEMCSGLYTLNDINQVERAFLKLIQYACWVDQEEINEFVKAHSVDFSL